MFDVGASVTLVPAPARASRPRLPSGRIFRGVYRIIPMVPSKDKKYEWDTPNAKEPTAGAGTSP